VVEKLEPLEKKQAKRKTGRTNGHSGKVSGKLKMVIAVTRLVKHSWQLKNHALIATAIDSFALPFAVAIIIYWLSSMRDEFEKGISKSLF